MQHSLQTKSPSSAALGGGMLVLPFVAANAIIGNRIEPFFTFIRPGLHTSPFEYGLLALVLACIPTGAFIAVRPLLAKGTHPPKRVYLINGGIAICMLVLFVFLAAGLGGEIYRCDVLRIPNCD